MVRAAVEELAAEVSLGKNAELPAVVEESVEAQSAAAAAVLASNNGDQRGRDASMAATDTASNDDGVEESKATDYIPDSSPLLRSRTSTDLPLLTASLEIQVATAH